MLTMHIHSTDTCPCDRHVLVVYLLDDDPELRVDRAGSLAWGLRGQPGRISHWAPVEVGPAGGDSSGRPRLPRRPPAPRSRNTRTLAPAALVAASDRAH